jgi:hypothetical protein
MSCDLLVKLQASLFGQGCSEVASLGHACVSDTRKEMRMSLVMRFFLGTRLANPIESPEPVVLGCVLMFSEWCQMRMNALGSFQKAAVALSNTGVGSQAFLSGYSFGQSNRVPEPVVLGCVLMFSEWCRDADARTWLISESSCCPF